mgnify:CR=1 FL=1
MKKLFAILLALMLLCSCKTLPETSEPENTPEKIPEEEPFRSVVVAPEYFYEFRRDVVKYSSINPESDFAKSAVDFAKRKMSVTHLVMDEQGGLVAIFSLTHKAVKIQEAVLSSVLKKKIKRYAQLDEESGSYMVSAFLIAQFGRNYEKDTENLLSGNSLMDNAIDILMAVQHEIGGGVVYLEWEDKPQLLSFYQNATGVLRYT